MTLGLSVIYLALCAFGAPAAFAQSISTRSSSAFDQVLTFENEVYLVTLLVGSGDSDQSGLRWGGMSHKPTATPYLYPEDNSGIFMVFGDRFMIDSTDFTVDEIQRRARDGTKDCRIVLSNAEHLVSAMLRIETDETDRMRWSLQVRNDGDTPRRIQPIFPYMGRIRLGDALVDNKYFYPWRGGIVGQIDCDLKYEYGNLAWMQVISVFNPGLGAALLTYPEDATGAIKGMPFKKSYGGDKQTVEHRELVLANERPYVTGRSAPHDILAPVDQGIAFAFYYPSRTIDAGHSFELPPTAIRIYTGGWKEALEDYSAWAHTWYDKVETPAWLAGNYNAVGAHPGFYYSETANRYIRSENMGDPDPIHLEQWAFWWDYSDRNNPFVEAGDFYYHRGRGGLTAFADEIAGTQAKGSRMTVYINNRFYWQESDIGRARRGEWAVKDFRFRLQTYQNPEDLYLGCSYEPDAWVDYLASTCGRVVRDTGMDGIYLDELALTRPCYNKAHVHFQEDGQPYSVDRLRQFLTKARDAMQAENPEAILMAEHAGSDYFTQFFDGSWDQTFYKRGFAHAEEHFDENSINYFRFYFPEFKLIFWGPNDDWERRSLFTGMGMADFPLSFHQVRAGQLQKENSDAFATLAPEPIIPTYIDKVLANKFPVEAKTLYTVYNKTPTDYRETAIMQVEHRPGFHYVEIFRDRNEIAVNRRGANDELVFSIDAGEVLCVGQFPEIMRASADAGLVQVALERYRGDETLVAFFNFDNSAYGFGDAVLLPLEDGRGRLSIPSRHADAKIILKLHRESLLLDQVVLDPLPAASTAVQGNASIHGHSFSLSPNFPNPFNSDTVISFQLPARTGMELTIYNLAGQKLVTLVQATREAGRHAARWDGRDGDGRDLSSGVFVLRLRTAEGQVKTRKLLLLR